MSVQEEAKRREKLEYYCNQILRWNKWLVSSFTRNTERTRILESDQLRCEGAGPRLGTLLRWTVTVPKQTGGSDWSAEVGGAGVPTQTQHKRDRLIKESSTGESRWRLCDTCHTPSTQWANRLLYSSRTGNIQSPRWLPSGETDPWPILTKYSRTTIAKKKQLYYSWIKEYLSSIYVVVFVFFPIYNYL